RGPARQAGAKPGDIIVSVDGKDTKGVPLPKVIDWIRGDEGEPVTLAVRQPKETETRTLKMIRAKVPFDTVLGYRRASAEEWRYRMDPDAPIGYLTIRTLNAGTLHDLRQAEAHLQSEGARALVLDLRFTGGEDTDAHNAALVADALLESGLLWRYHDPQG